MRQSSQCSRWRSSSRTSSGSSSPSMYSEILSMTLSGNPKTGQRWSGQNRPTEGAGDSVVLPCSLLWRQVYFRTPTPRTAFENMPMMEEAIEHGGDGGAIAQQFAPVVDGSVRGEQSTGALIASHHDLQQFLGGGDGQLAHTE